MNILVALDRFGDKLSSHAANIFVEEGIKQTASHSEVIKLSLFDGTKDMIDGVLQWNSGKRYQWNVPGGHLQQKRVVIAGIDKKLFIDCSTLFDDVIDLKETSSAGLGQVILNGLDLGYESFTIALGRTTIMDGGVGMLELLGARFYDMNGDQMTGPLSAVDIKRIRNIDLSYLDDRLHTSKFTVISDRSYYLYGNHSHVADLTIDEEDQKSIDNTIWYLNEQFKKIGINLTRPSDGGDGGGLRAVFSEVLSAEVLTSKELIFRETDIEGLIEEADMIIFGGGTETASKGSLVSQAVMAHSQPDKIYIYLTAGSQLPSDADHIYHLNVYPEMTSETNDLQIGIQLQNTIKTILKLMM